MVISFICTITVFLFGGNHKPNTFQAKPNVNDTSYLKTLKYEKLNSLVSYHIIQNGKSVSKFNLVFTIKPIATYYYYHHRYEKQKKDTQQYGKAGDLTKLILSNKFSNKKDFDGLFRINAKSMFVYKPWILNKITVTPKTNDDKELHVLMSKLEKEKFVSHISLSTTDSKSLGFKHGFKNSYIAVLLKPTYRNIKETNDIQKTLMKWADIKDVLTSVSFLLVIANMKRYIELHREKRCNESGKRDSNPRPSVWETDALPAELFPLI